MRITGTTSFPMSASSNISRWKVSGDWFDVCKCNIPCPCTFAQAPSSGDCAGILVWHIQKGQYSDTALDGLNVLGIGSFTGNIWAGQAKDATFGFFITVYIVEYTCIKHYLVWQFIPVQALDNNNQWP